MCNTNTFYVGYTQDLKARITLHSSGLVFSTKNKLPVELIYYEACINQFDALKREKYLKSGPGKKFIKNRIKYYLKSASASYNFGSWL